MNRSGIEWCDHTWNPITGCRHGCRYCYARAMVARFAGDIRLNMTAKSDYGTERAADGNGRLFVLDKPMLNETGHPLVYPFGFEPTFHRYRLETPGALDKLKSGNNIFVGAMADVWGNWVPEEWISEVLTACLEHPIHNYLFLTKNPERYTEFDKSGRLPAAGNFWYGSTVTRPGDRFFRSGRHRTFWSIEPIHASFDGWDWAGSHPDWVIIGAETGSGRRKNAPERSWVMDITEHCAELGIPVFMKNSLTEVVGEQDMRREYPAELRMKKLSPKMQKKLYDVCAGCGRRQRKDEMLTMMARSARGETAKQFGFLCRQCFAELCEGYGFRVPVFDHMKNEGGMQDGKKEKLPQEL